MTKKVAEGLFYLKIKGKMLQNNIIAGIFFLMFSINFSYGQSDSKGGEFEFGVRNTYSLFSAESETGFGAGGQFRIRLGDRLNTEWFADFIKNDIQGLGSRTDGHIGWSVMFYPKWIESKVNLYILAGHCFDYTKVVAFETAISEQTFAERWSSAVQMGLGTSWQVSERANISLSGQYMLHLGNPLHADVEEHFGVKELHVHSAKGAGAEGHLLLNLSVNFRIADLW